MRFFLQTSHKLVVFLLFITVWTDLILPTPYKNSDLAFWLFCALFLTWFYFAFRVLDSLNKSEAARFRIPFYIAFCLLSIGLTSDWLLGFDTGYIGNIHIGIWKGFCYAFIVFVIAKLLLHSEGESITSLKGVSTLGLIFVLPIGSWWIHQRVQKAASANRSQSFET